MNKRGQSWSIDIVLAVVIFGFIAVSITSFALLDEPESERLQQEAQLVDSRLETQLAGCNATVSQSTINQDGLECLFGLNYSDIRSEIRTSGDFCIFLEDEEGRIITIRNKTGIGGDELLVGGKPCGQE